jgi:hypothetical protein
MDLEELICLMAASIYAPRCNVFQTEKEAKELREWSIDQAVALRNAFMSGDGRSR